MDDCRAAEVGGGGGAEGGLQPRREQHPQLVRAAEQLRAILLQLAPCGLAQVAGGQHCPGDGVPTFRVAAVRLAVRRRTVPPDSASTPSMEKVAQRRNFILGSWDGVPGSEAFHRVSHLLHRGPHHLQRARRPERCALHVRAPPGAEAVHQLLHPPPLGSTHGRKLRHHRRPTELCVEALSAEETPELHVPMRVQRVPRVPPRHGRQQLRPRAREVVLLANLDKLPVLAGRDAPQLAEVGHQAALKLAAAGG
mmetsp:Transcript_24308/g.62306  ORF Transcript_24308/g.62306 Transcript_24308/m.62306 type:complete len:252 (-) Transcript_24308:139-894(-)